MKQPAATWLRCIVWTVVALATLAIAAVPLLASLEDPGAPGTIVVDRATLLRGGGPAAEVTLPHAVFPGTGAPQPLQYSVDLGERALTGDNPSLYIPQFTRPAVLALDGENFYDSDAHTLWTGPMVGQTLLVRLPARARAPGPHRLTLVLEVGPYVAPTFMSRMYLGPEAALVPSFKWRTFLDIDVKVMSLAAQVLLGVGVILAWLLRPATPLLSWLAAFQIANIPTTIAMIVGYQPELREFLPYVIAMVPAWSLASIGVSLLLIGIRPPTALRLGIVAVTVVLLGCAVIGTPLARSVVAVAAIGISCGAGAVSTGVIAWGALRRGNIDAQIMLAPALLAMWFLLCDAYSAAMPPEHALRLFTPLAGLILVAAQIAVLMRRMAASFDELDRSNETLNLKLAEREAELAILARQERMEATRLVREQERGRLTRDLHDGISGHLVSIIALAERADADPIEQAAREALNDLRLVIYSLDLGDSDLPLALANFRERLIPQLQRLGVALDWSTANLPEVSGVTPGNALAVLRILQEAITNALKHGPATRIGIRGSASADGRAAIVVENDGQPFVAGTGGRGLDNMRRRAEQLHAKLCLEPFDRGMRLTLSLPCHLPDLKT
jgi:two-component system sensor histidine kinase UhpB